MMNDLPLRTCKCTSSTILTLSHADTKKLKRDSELKGNEKLALKRSKKEIDNKPQTVGSGRAAAQVRFQFTILLLI